MRFIKIGCLLGMSVLLLVGLAVADLDISALDKFILKDEAVNISLDLNDVPIGVLFRAISATTGISFILDKDVKKYTVSLRVEDVPVEEFLQNFLSLYRLKLEKVADKIFIVKEQEEEQLVTRVFTLKHAVVPGAKIIDKASQDVALGPSDTGEAEGEGGLSGKGLFDALETVLSERGSAVCDPRTNSILVKDVASNMDNIARVIESLDKPVPQILISVDMLDISKNLLDLIGIDWATPILSLSDSYRYTKFPFLGRSLDFWKTTRESGQLAKVDFPSLSLFLRKIDGQVRYLARPRIFTLNGEPAKISISTEEAIGQKATYDEGKRVVSEPERYTTGVLLEVTPLVNVEKKEITMVVVPRLVETKPSKLGDDYRDPEERGLKTVVRVKDGDTVVLGGLIKHLMNKSYTGLPGFKRFLRHLFGRDYRESLDRELLIFITPKIWEADSFLRKDQEKGDPLKDRLSVMAKELDLLGR